ncbi:MAG: nucleoside deaminase [Candidatus Saccharibacteria bacterium]
MTHEAYMREAIKIAKETEAQGGAAIGAILVKDGEIIAVGHSLPGLTFDATAHGETTAIRAACQNLKTINLDGCMLYSTLESCGMCLSAAVWSNLSACYFGAYASDVPENHYELKDYGAEKLAPQTQRWDGTPVQVTGGILREKCKALLEGYKDWTKQ